MAAKPTNRVLQGAEALAAFSALENKRQPRVRGAKRTGHYASKREARYADELALQKRAGKVLFWLEQVRIPVSDTRKYVVDFVVFEPNRVRFVEIKGFETEVWKIKRDLLREREPEIFKRLEVVKQRAG